MKNIANRTEYDFMVHRKSGILLHLTSLPSGWGIGDMGPMGYRFVDLLWAHGQSVWQILPLNPTEEIYDFSPYNSTSAFAGNSLLVSLEMLVEEGYLCNDDLPSKFGSPDADFKRASSVRKKLLQKAYDCFFPSDEFQLFCKTNEWWLEDYALYQALKSYYRLPWYMWPQDLRMKEPGAVDMAKEKFADYINKEKFVQYVFYDQWGKLHHYAKSRGIGIFGDMPLYVAHDSADVWANQEMFCLDDEGMPLEVSGVPPDYFSTTGQYWGNPLYDWEIIEERGFEWWIKRFEHAFSLYDMVRIDHFRGLVAYWAIPFYESTAVNGRWVKGPAERMFAVLKNRLGDLPIIAEDLGDITDDVRQFMDDHDIPGMRVLLFGMENPKGNIHIPFYYKENCVAYTGTHDNNTVTGWYSEEASPQAIRNLALYLGHKTDVSSVSRDMIRLVELSVAKLVIIPFQDILGLDSSSRMNKPASREGNWRWRMHEDMMSAPVLKWFKEITGLADRC